MVVAGRARLLSRALGAGHKVCGQNQGWAIREMGQLVVVVVVFIFALENRGGSCIFSAIVWGVCHKKKIVISTFPKGTLWFTIRVVPSGCSSYPLFHSHKRQLLHQMHFRGHSFPNGHFGP